MSGLVDRITAVHLAHRVRVAPIRSWPRTFMCSCGDWSVQAEDGEEQGCAHVAERVAAELPELAELEATKLLLEATREQLSRTIADFCAVRDALPRKQVEQILSAVEDQP